MDKGTENVKVAGVQYALRAEHSDEFAREKSFRYGSSPSNIVICISCEQLLVLKVIFIIENRVLLVSSEKTQNRVVDKSSQGIYIIMTLYIKFYRSLLLMSTMKIVISGCNLT